MAHTPAWLPTTPWPLAPPPVKKTRKRRCKLELLGENKDDYIPILSLSLSPPAIPLKPSPPSLSSSSLRSPHFLYSSHCPTHTGLHLLPPLWGQLRLHCRLPRHHLFDHRLLYPFRRCLGCMRRSLSLSLWCSHLGGLSLICRHVNRKPMNSPVQHQHL
jgi:hypothetical protein